MVMPESQSLFLKKVITVYKGTFCFSGNALLLNSFKLRVVLEKGYLSLAPFSAAHTTEKYFLSFTQIFLTLLSCC